MTTDLEAQLQDLQISPDVEKMNAKEADSTLRTLEMALDLGRMKEAEILTLIHRKNFFTELGYKTFIAYCDSVGLAERTVYEKISVANYMKKLNVPAEKVEQIGWTKISRIVPVSDETSRDYWLEKAKNLSLRQLRDEIKQSKVSGGCSKSGDPDKEVVGVADVQDKATNKFTVMLSDNQLENVLSAIRNAKDRTRKEVRSNGYYLDLICLAFNADAVMSAEGTSLENKLEWFLQRIESTFGVKLEVAEKGD